MKQTIYAFACHENNGNDCSRGKNCWCQGGDDVTNDITEAERCSASWSGKPYKVIDDGSWHVEWYTDDTRWGKLVTPNREFDSISMEPL